MGRSWIRFRKSPSSLALAAVAALAIVLGGAACTSDTKVITQPASANNDVVGIAVSGHGEVVAPVDTGYLTVGVQFRSSTVAAARDGAAKAADALVKSLKSNSIDDKDIKTTQVSINPEYDYRNASEPRITGYMVTNTVTVTVRKVDGMSKVVDDAIAAGGDAVRIQSIRFDVLDNTKYIEQARQAAMDEAKKKAGQLAGAGGVKLGKPVAISETQTTKSQPIAAAADARGAQSAAPVPTTIQPGTGSITVDVAVRYLIES